MEKFDLIVIGSGAGMNVASNAVGDGLRVAMLEHDLMGGTCLNTGCIPTKILTYPADVIRQLQEAGSIGVKGSIESVDFPLIMKRMRTFVDRGRTGMEAGVNASKLMTWFKGTGEFVGDHTMKVNGKQIFAPKIVIAAGSRPHVPSIPGLEGTGFIDNVSALHLKKLPKSIIILGGGYIACEFGHFFSALGVDVTILGRNPRLLKNEEPEISAIVKKRFSRFVKIHTGIEAVKVEKSGDKKIVYGKNTVDNKLHKFQADELMTAAGRISNADLFKPEMTGVKTDVNGWIFVNKYLNTSKPGIWALGDALGKHMFRHTANFEAEVVWRNAFTKHKIIMDYHAIPHAVFGHPQVASVGMTEAQAVSSDHVVLVGTANYTDVTKGYAMNESESLVKVIVDGPTRKILGCHIVGSEAAEMVQQMTYLMNAGDHDYMPMARAQVIHPALSEVVLNAFSNLAPVGSTPDNMSQHAH